jgi:serine/threonine protein kinase
LADWLYSVAASRPRGVEVWKADTPMSDLWAKLEGHAVNGAFPLRRYLGGSNHSVVFLTESARLGRSELALKLVPAVPALAQLQLARWRASAGFSHTHLIGIFDAGQCQIGERHFLYVVTDYADQHLAQLLERRALSEDEAREMLEPVLEALAFLHDKKVVQGRLKPSNVLVVGDQLRLATDTIRPFSETGRAANVTSVYLPPEARDGLRAAASDVWALGVTLCEALTRQQPSALETDETLLPASLPPAFRGVVARCLSRRAQDRPTVGELQVWARGAQLVASLSASGSHAAISNSASSAGAPEVVGEAHPQSPQASRDTASDAPSGVSMGLVLLVILGAFVLFVAGWVAVRSSGPRRAPPTPDTVVDAVAMRSATLVPTANNSSDDEKSAAPDESRPFRPK